MNGTIRGLNRKPPQPIGEPMAVVGEYADTLRAVGRYLDEIGAADVVILQELGDLRVLWRGGSGGQEQTQQIQAFGPEELRALRTTARLFRGRERHRARFSLSELLRTLGELADEMDAAGLNITESPEGFLLTVQAFGESVSESFTHAELVARSHARHRWRLAPQIEPQSEN
jgi:hypothetical protein